MGVNKGEKFAKQDVYIEYSYENVMFRWDHIKSETFVKFYNKPEHNEVVPHDNNHF